MVKCRSVMDCGGLIPGLNDADAELLRLRLRPVLMLPATWLMLPPVAHPL